MTRRVIVRLLLLIGILAGLVAVPLVAYWFRDREEWRSADTPATEESEEPEPKSFEDLFADDLEVGCQVEKPLDLPGPYTRKLDSWAWPEGSSVRLRESDHHIVCEYRVPEGHTAYTIKAETVDGGIAHGLLLRKEK